MFKDFQNSKKRLQVKTSLVKRVSKYIKAPSSFKLTMF